MKQRKLEMLLERVEGFESPSAALEQYATPAVLAAEILHFAYMQGDLEDTVFDLGCGTGILAIGAKLLGAREVTGFDLDRKALETARRNAESMGVDVEFVHADISEIEGHAHTVVMNPPFGAQAKGNDRPFLLSALRTSDVVYSIHNSGSHDFISRFIGDARISDWYTTAFPLKRTFKFHKKDVEIINVEIYRIMR
ncbi:METTL5 family protein [Methanolobus chelungpuianus]|uniref:Methyltransferase-like protein 5 n=1 Tax=Methanolobus chelungpuianus TaxID=502115 RepID=A0AAE3H9T8_9EURY|nr:METTL5 family protein [Methanolobus chelungpuianus]MCQ6962621.1 methyltransferase [Methanolobus chelungpuianus]